MTTRIVPALMATFWAASPASAQVMTGNDLYFMCQDATGGALQGFCNGYILALNEGLKLGTAIPFMAAGTGQSAEEIDGTVQQMLMVCPPAGVDYIQLTDIAVQYLQSHPETRHEPARALVLQAWQGAFPCQMGGSQ